MRTASRLLCILLLLSCRLPAADQAVQAGLDRTLLNQVPLRLHRMVDDGAVAGAVTLVARHGRVAGLEAVGQADIAAQRRMRPDSLFWIASMTKPITATAVLMLQDEGRLSIDDPVEKHLPEFTGQWLIASRGTDSMTLKRAPRPITLRDLLTHTSGLGEVTAPRPDSSLAELVMGYAMQPLQFAPGGKWQYSNPGMNTLGRVVEVVSGQSFQDFLQRRLFTPLGMKDTTFWPTARQARRLAKSYQARVDGQSLEETSIFLLPGELTSRKRTPFPAGGLFSTAADLFRLYQMMLNGGTYQGRRYVSAEAVKLMTRPQTGDLKAGFTDGMSFGLGWQVVKEPTGVTGMLSRGTFGHGGAYGTQGWIDPGKDMILILMIQRAKLPNADGSDMRRVFQETAVSAVLN
jgi:CubicO group peptidase (beta-lactamase class C family)